MWAGLAGAFMAWTFTLCGILLLAKITPRMARAAKPGLSPVARGFVFVVRPLRLPVACIFAFGALLFVGLVLGTAYGYFMATAPRTCALVPGPNGGEPLIPTCEIGHPYHQQLVELGQ